MAVVIRCVRRATRRGAGSAACSGSAPVRRARARGRGVSRRRCGDRRQACSPSPQKAVAARARWQRCLRACRGEFLHRRRARARAMRRAVLAHPGPPHFNLGTRRLSSSRASEQSSLGSVLGSDRLETRMRTEPFRAAPVAAFYFLDRHPELTNVSFEPVTSPSRQLHASSYNFRHPHARAASRPARSLRPPDGMRAADTCHRACGGRPEEARCRPAWSTRGAPANGSGCTEVTGR